MSTKPKTSRNPYHNLVGKPELKNSALVLMDILGYREMAKHAHGTGKQQQFLDELFDALTESRRWLDQEADLDLTEKDFYALKAFTDNIVMGFPINGDGESELDHAIEKATEFQFNMAIKGFFVRGAISVGEAYVDDMAVVGNALTEAYEAESSLARDPRIILTPSSVQMIKKHMSYYRDGKNSPQARDVLKDSDGQWFVNYLEEVLIAEDAVGPFFDVLEQHKAAVEQKLSQHKANPAIFAKYSWVAGYHNFFCDLHSEHFSEEHKINTDLFRALPRRIFD